MRAGAAAAVVGALAAGFVAGRWSVRESGRSADGAHAASATDGGAPRPQDDGVPPAQVTASATAAPAGSRTNAARAQRAERTDGPAAADAGVAYAGDVVARIAALTPSSWDESLSRVQWTGLPPETLAAAMREALARKLTLESLAGRLLRPLAEAFDAACPGVRLDAEALLAFAAGSDEEIVRKLAAHVDAAGAARWFDALVVEQVHADSTPWRVRSAAALRAAEIGLPEQGARIRGTFAQAVRSPSVKVRIFAAALAAESPAAFGSEVARVALGDDSPDVRSDALRVLGRPQFARAIRDDPALADDVRRAVHAAFDSPDPAIQSLGIALAPQIGAAGAAACARLLERGGLSAQDEVGAVAAIALHGDLEALLVPGMGAGRATTVVRGLAKALGIDAEAVARRPRLGAAFENVPCPHDLDDAETWTRLCSNVGRNDLLIGAFRDAGTPDPARLVSLAWAMDGTPDEAVDAARRVLADPAVPASFRRAVVDTLADAPEVAREHALRVLRAVATSDANAAVRAAAAAGAAAME